MHTRVRQVFVPLTVFLITGNVLAENAIFTTEAAGTAVNKNIYGGNTDVYLSGGA